EALANRQQRYVARVRDAEKGHDSHRYGFRGDGPRCGRPPLTLPSYAVPAKNRTEAARAAAMSQPRRFALLTPPCNLPSTHLSSALHAAGSTIRALMAFGCRFLQEMEGEAKWTGKSGRRDAKRERPCSARSTSRKVWRARTSSTVHFRTFST